MQINNISNLIQLANFLRCDTAFLEAYLSGDVVVFDHNTIVRPEASEYTSIIDKLYLRKKNRTIKSYREVFSVRTETLKNLLKALSTFLKEAHTPSLAVHGYVIGKNIRTNAEKHLAKRNLLSVDISNFFGSITIEMVCEAFSSIGFSDISAQHLSKIVTINDFLPPGFSTSPIISNMVANKMDQNFLFLCNCNCTYTRYADDLYFSSNDSLPSLKDISEIIIGNGFTLNEKKTKYMPRGVKQYVTGLTVFDHVSPRITNKIKRNLRLEIHYLFAYGMRGHVLKKMGRTLQEYDTDDYLKFEVDAGVQSVHNRITGWLRFMNSVESCTAQKLINKYDKVVL
jgi:RNA-directed DNA polymerase